ncbi:uncharacterized protein LOC142001118 [Carettochelys insculpta]|uniref:uncharacterized protein LOC142001118 n=1 Tax=Carettochelys insculpta TaxID=44489 RepID=UPI003EBDEFB4
MLYIRHASQTKRKKITSLFATKPSRKVSDPNLARANILLLPKSKTDSCPLLATSARANANSMSLMRTSRTLELAFSLARLNSFPSDLVCSKMPSVEDPKACFSRSAKKIPNNVGASTHPCLTPLLILKASDNAPSYWMVPLMSSWNNWIILSNRGGQPILWSSLNRPSLLTKSKALVADDAAVVSHTRPASKTAGSVLQSVQGLWAYHQPKEDKCTRSGCC